MRIMKMLIILLWCSFLSLLLLLFLLLFLSLFCCCFYRCCCCCYYRCCCCWWFSVPFCYLQTDMADHLPCCCYRGRGLLRPGRQGPRVPDRGGEDCPARPALPRHKPQDSDQDQGIEGIQGESRVRFRHFNYTVTVISISFISLHSFLQRFFWILLRHSIVPMYVYVFVYMYIQYIYVIYVFIRLFSIYLSIYPSIFLSIH